MLAVSIALMLAGQHIFLHGLAPWEAGIALYVLSAGLLLVAWRLFEAPVGTRPHLESDTTPDRSGGDGTNRHSGPITRFSARTVMALLVTLVLAGIPSVLVVSDRWLGSRAAATTFREPWCAWQFLCASSLPPYFLVVFLTTLVLAIWFMAFHVLQPATFARRLAPVRLARELPFPPLQRAVGLGAVGGAALGFLIVAIRALASNRLPGWDLCVVLGLWLLGWMLMDLRRDAVDRILRASYLTVVLVLGVHLSFVNLLAVSYTGTASSWPFLVAFLLTSVALLTYSSRLHGLLWTTTIALSAYTLFVDGWWFSVIGDEYIFIRYAIDILERADVHEVGSKLFWGQYVYGAHPYISSLILALSMAIFGTDNFGWRFSNLYLSALSLPLYYYFFQTFLLRRIAILAVVLLAFSHYIMTFGKIGSNNLHSFFAQSLILAVASWAIQSHRSSAFVLLGLSIGLCFYVYPGALYVTPIPFLLFAIYYRTDKRSALFHFAIVMIGLLMMMFPLVMQPDYWLKKVPGTVYYNPKIVGSTGDSVHHWATNLLYSLFSFVYTPEEMHFVAVSYMDPISAVFVFIGAAIVLRRIRDSKLALFLAVSVALLLVLVGASHDRQHPPASRMFLLLPWFAMVAAVGLAWCETQLQRAGCPPRFAFFALPMVVTLVAGANLYLGYPLSRERMAGRYQSAQVLFLDVGKRIFAGVDGDRRRVVFANNPSTLSVDAWREMLRIYGVPVSTSQMVEVPVGAAPLGDAARSAMAEKDTVVVVDPRLDPGAIRSVEAVLAELGKEGCVIRNTLTEPRFTFWYAPALRHLCQPPR